MYLLYDLELGKGKEEEDEEVEEVEEVIRGRCC